jgi:hypothetical protein
LNCARALVLATSVILCGCGDDKQGHDVDVTQACDRLEDLAGVVLSVRSATSAQEVQTALDGPLAAFVEAADQSGDGRLAELAHTYDSRFADYLQGSGIDARQAGNEADIALDRAGARCTELGAANVFPQES